jgi:RND family efflux transporter MFP subunit
MKKLFLFLILGAPTLLMGQDSLEVLEVEIQDSYKEIKLIPGKVLPTQISNLAFEIPGIVYKINADIGDRFAKGDVLAELDSREVNANFMQAEARFKLSKLALDRFEDLKKDGFISAQEFDRASAEYDVAKSELEFFKVKLSQTKITAPYDGFIHYLSRSYGLSICKLNFR